MHMERSVASLTYKGSVSDAIVEAQRQKRLFVVYISGDDENSMHLERSTWVDDNVAESISKYCILLHLTQGSIDALQFSAIYPQKSIPSITAVGYNGLMLWQHEGYINKENFVAHIEKAWAALHFQETAVTLLTAALTSKKPLDSSAQDVSQGNSSALDIASTSSGKSAENEDRSMDDSKKNARCNPDTSSHSGIVSDMKIEEKGQSSSEDNTSEEVMCSVIRDVNEMRDVHSPSSSNIIDVLTTPQEAFAPVGNCSEASPDPVKRGFVSEASPDRVKKALACGPESPQITIVTKEEKTKNEEDAELTDSPHAVKSDDIYLNIRLPNGASLQRKFAVMDTLRSVKGYVDENQASDFGPYDLAVPHPRKVFGEQDLSSVLSELGFAARQALIVVPHRHATRPQRNVSSLHANQNAESKVNSADDGAGYFAFVRRVLSYINPFSYLGGNASSSNSDPALNDGYRQYRPDLAFQSRQLSGAGVPDRPSDRSQQNPSSSSNTGEMRGRTSRPFGSNIHTLRHDEDDFQSRDRNMFWNGNSTQFGGDDKK